MSAKPASRASALDAYLEWQADLGTAEVVLPAPWVKARATALSTQAPNEAQDDAGAPASAAFPESSHSTSSRSSSSASSTSAPEEFFRDIQKRLAEPARKPAAQAGPAAATPLSPAPRPGATVPEFASFDAYWNWLAAEYSRWFPSLSQSSASIVRAAGSSGAKLAVVELSPVGDALFAGAPGALLDKMLQAIGLSRETLYLTSVMKTPPAGKTWARKDIALTLPSFLAELRLAGCETALLLGEGCAQAVLRTGKSLAALDAVEEAFTDGNASDGKAIACVAAWHPADLLRDTALKAPAWARLKTLKTMLDRSQGIPS